MLENIQNKKIAVIGVSEDHQKYGYKIFESLLKAGFNVVGINNKGGEILGKKLYKNIAELDTTPDLVLTVVPAAVTEKIIDDCKQAGIKEVWMQPGSESESAINKAKELGIKTTSGACFMIQAKIW